jgi:hypothetical protein
MKIFSALLIFCALLFTNCKKNSTPPEIATNVIKTAPFENSDFKLERVSINLPADVRKVHFFDELNGICMDLSGKLFSTQDKGLTWAFTFDLVKLKNCSGSFGFEGFDGQTIVGFVGANDCSMTDPLSRTGLIFRSQNRGKTWSTDTIRNTQLRCMTLGGDKILYIAGEDMSVSNQNSAFFSSKDGGTTWDRKTFATNFSPLTNLIYLSAKQIQINGPIYPNSHNPYMESTDKGATWVFKHPGTGSEVTLGASQSDKMSYYLAFHSGTSRYSIYQNSEGNEGWTSVKSFKYAQNEVKCLSPTTALIMGKSGNGANAGLSYSVNAGKTWIEVETDTYLDAGQFITSSFYTPKNGYIVASKKVLYKIDFK